MLLGFSSGCLGKTNILEKETFDIFKSTGSNAIEIKCFDMADVSLLKNIPLENFC